MKVNQKANRHTGERNRKFIPKFIKRLYLKKLYNCCPMARVVNILI
ncbi:MAG: hypothetical protein BWX87_00636 [Bacteroidetes bacterium ADurb.Bin123]|nr:MAG: hypothetical protein BWX87_00636 [Bacteroidetes bacterium ADurb.Bin123]